ncbi:LYR motif-containing protein 4B [Helicoverpa zea]|uniref:LYR motif-containing protein 4B n=1 Tax=Helicoverpa zea TaxID=7113 RepID=UPI001F59A11F|nr:LYR motif-containing protein 4B [Helicoverpa zea]
MSSGVTKQQILSMYRVLLREADKFPNYNFRAYALRRVKNAFRDNKTLTDPKLIKKQYDFATENLAVIKRQVLVGDLYKTEKLVIEN